MEGRYSSPSAIGGDYYNVTDFYEQNRSIRKAGIGFLGVLLIVFLIAIILSIVIWIIWYRPLNIGLGEFLLIVLKTILNIVIWPFKFILQLLGIWPSELDDGKDIISLLPLKPPGTHTEIIKHEMSECPPCTNECVCPKCDEIDIRPYELEIKYLKNMVKMIGSIARRENAINSQYRELYPGFSVMSPHVRKLSHEYNFIKSELRKDPEEWQYFKNYFSRISGIPSSNQEVDYDLVL
jgi:hypothetical protein